MADGQRVYSDEEFALILRKAAELARKTELPAGSSTGLTLTEMKSAAAQAGLDPTLVERAARMLATTGSTSMIERLTGGPLRHNYEVRFPATLDENTAARLLSAIRIIGGVAGSRDVGHSGPMGMTWHDGSDMESLGITARPQADGTTVTLAVDRRGTVALVTMFSGIVMFFSLLFAGAALYPEGGAALAVGGAVTGIGGVLAVARSYWASSTRKIRERISGVIEAIGQTLGESETSAAALRKVDDE